MAWDQLWIDKPHLAYAIIGGFTSIFSLVSLFVKEKLYIGEATVATIVGVIGGRHCLGWFDPISWGNTDRITLEISRIVLVVQIFAVAVELPKKYMLKHWVSVTILLLPVMTFGWLISSLFIWLLVPSLTWVEGLAVAACVTATDPVLASAVVGKGKFAKRVPGHLRNLLSAESGCNDGMAFPFAYLAINCIRHAGDHKSIAFHFIVITCLYECVFGSFLGVVIGYTGRHLIKFAEKRNLIDRESFLSFYFVLALFCTGIGSIIGTDDLLVSFAAGTAFSWDGWFTKRTEESHVSNVIDLLINMSFFVYFGAIVPWEQFNNFDIGIKAWKLVLLALCILVFRRLPIMLAMKPFTSDIRTWREALFCGHFGPIGVGAIFISILTRAELESGEPTPLRHLPPKDTPHYYAIACIWPVTNFLVITSILVHGSSVAVFALGKRLNNMTITMSYTTNGNNQSWLQRLPRIEGGKTLSLQKVDTEEPSKFKIGTTAKPAGGMKKRKGRKQAPEPAAIDLKAGKRVSDSMLEGEEEKEEEINVGDQAFQEGHHIIVEDPQGEVITTVDRPKHPDQVGEGGEEGQQKEQETGTTSSSTRRRANSLPTSQHRRAQQSARSGDGRKVVAYQLDDTIIVENEEGEVIRRYRINRRMNDNAQQQQQQDPLKSFVQGFDKTLAWVGLKRQDSQVGGVSSSSPNASSSAQQPSTSHGNTDDVENQHDDLVRIDGKEDELTVDEETMKTQLKTLLNQNQVQQHHTSSSSSSSPKNEADKMPRNFLSQEQDTEDEDTNVDIEDSEETEVERKRRLAALGLAENDENSDDEEETVGSSRVVPPAIREEEHEDDEEDDDEEEQRPRGIRWSEDVKKKH